MTVHLKQVGLVAVREDRRGVRSNTLFAIGADLGRAYQPVLKTFRILDRRIKPLTSVEAKSLKHNANLPQVCPLLGERKQVRADNKPIKAGTPRARQSNQK